MKEKKQEDKTDEININKFKIELIELIVKNICK